MKTSILCTALLLVSSSATGCAVFSSIFGIEERKRQEEAEQQRAKNEAEAVVREREQKAAVAAAKRESERRLKIEAARKLYLEEQLDAHVYAQSCKDIEQHGEKAIIKLGYTVVEFTPDLIVTSWSYNSSAGRSRCVIELESTGNDGCRVRALVQYASGSGGTISQRSLDVARSILEEVEPQRHARLEQEYEAIENQYPPQ